MGNKNIESEVIRNMIMAPLIRIRIVFALYVISNIIFFILEGKIGLYKLVDRSLCFIFLFIGLLGAEGYKDDSVPLLLFSAVKTISFLVLVFKGGTTLDWISLTVTSILGIILCVLLMIDRAKYYYEEEFIDDDI